MARFCNFAITVQLRRTTADKQRAIEAALRHPQGAGKSDNSIAMYLGVDHKTVSAVREKLSGKIYQIENREVTRNGTTYTQNTANIGQRPAPIAPIRYTGAREFDQSWPTSTRCILPSLAKYLTGGFCNSPRKG